MDFLLRNIKLLIGFLALSCLIVFLYWQKTKEPALCAVTIDSFYCGTVDLADNISEGKHLFKAQCQACHLSDRNLTGPALASLDSVYFIDYFQPHNNDNESMGRTFHSNYTNYLDNADLVLIYQYINY